MHHDGPIIPMPPLTRDALREAVKRLSLVNLPQFDLEAGRAFDQASHTGSTAPLQIFLKRWGVFVAIERDPRRAAHLHEAERISQDGSAGEEAFHAAKAEINGILREAEQEIEGLQLLRASLMDPG
ncbi:hypothetical protein SNL152K_6183 [Streptomyces sp. NL15-2K]|nr:hypothetical protein SNL152K_6183 [Streptomyces sp. NL15-2K]